MFFLKDLALLGATLDKMVGRRGSIEKTDLNQRKKERVQ